MGDKPAVAPTIIMTRPDMTRVEEATDFVQKGGVFQRQQVKGELALPTTHRDLALSVDIANKATSLMNNTLSEQRMIDGHATHLGTSINKLYPIIQESARNQYQENDDLTKNAGATMFSKAAQHATPNVPETERDKFENRSFYGNAVLATRSGPATDTISEHQSYSSNRIDAEYRPQQTMGNTRNRVNLGPEQSNIGFSGRENQNILGANSTVVHHKMPASMLPGPESTTNQIRESHSQAPSRITESFNTNSILRSESTTNANLVRDLTLHAHDRHNMVQQRTISHLPSAESAAIYSKQRYADNLVEQRTNVAVAQRTSDHLVAEAAMRQQTTMKQNDIGVDDRHRRHNTSQTRFGVGNGNQFDSGLGSVQPNRLLPEYAQPKQIDAGPRRFADDHSMTEQTNMPIRSLPNRDQTTISTTRQGYSAELSNRAESDRQMRLPEPTLNRHANMSSSIRTGVRPDDEQIRVNERIRIGEGPNDVRPNIGRSGFEAPVGLNVASPESSNGTVMSNRISYNRGNEQHEMFTVCSTERAKPTSYDTDSTRVSMRPEIANDNFSGTGLKSVKAKVSPLSDTVELDRATNRQVDSVDSMSRSAKVDTTNSTNSASMRQAMTDMTTTGMLSSAKAHGEINLRKNHTGNAFERSKPKVYQLDDDATMTNRNTYSEAADGVERGSVNVVGPQHQPLVSRETILVNDAKNEQELLHSQRFDGTVVRGPERTPDKDSMGAVANRDDSWITQTRLPGKGTFVK
jgi:hypothetical protein